MSESDDVDQLTRLLRDQRILGCQLRYMVDTEKKKALVRRKKIQSQIVGLVDRHFRSYLAPRLTGSFPNKNLKGQRTPVTKANVGVTAQFSELLNDFFGKVLKDEESKWWQKETPAELRSYVTLALNNNMISKIRRRKRQIPLEDDSVFEILNGQFANEVISRFAPHGVDSVDALEVIRQWDDCEDEVLRKYAHVLRLTFIGDMKEHQIESDLNNKFDLRDVPLPLREVASRMGESLSNVGRWKQLALNELKIQLESVNKSKRNRHGKGD